MLENIGKRIEKRNMNKNYEKLTQTDTIISDRKNYYWHNKINK